MSEVDIFARKIWDYMVLNQNIEKADAILALGSLDMRVADRAAELYKEGYAPDIICSGGIAHTSDLNATGWDRPEAEMYKRRLLELGIPEEKIIIENQSRNSGENAVFTKELLKNRKMNFAKMILVQKPWMERRMYATFKKQWPELDIVVTSPQFPYEEYLSNDKEKYLNIMVGDLERIKEYPELGYQIKQDIPDDVLEAWEYLVDMGYDGYLIKKRSAILQN